MIENITAGDIDKNTRIKINGGKIKILDFLDNGAYGSIYHCKYCDNKNYVIKFSNNENPNTLLQRNLLLSKFSVKMELCGNLLQNEDYTYYSIMEYGGITLKNFIKNNKQKPYDIIIKQLHNIVSYIKENKILLPDLKTSNIVINEQNEIKLIDIYLERENCVQNINCSIVRTYPTIDLCVCKLHTTGNYNYSYINVLYGFILLELYEYGIYTIYKTFCNKYNIKTKIKIFVLWFQLSCLMYHKIVINMPQFNKFKKKSIKKCNYIENIYVDFLKDLPQELKKMYISNLFLASY